MNKFTEFLNDSNTDLTLDEYQLLSSRTIGTDFTPIMMAGHALHGMVSEIGELHGLYQKAYQGHPMDDEHVMKEVGDVLWFLAEYCTGRGWHLGDIAMKNVNKLKARYPDGFEAEKSLNRKDGDV